MDLVGATGKTPLVLVNLKHLVLYSKHRNKISHSFGIMPDSYLVEEGSSPFFLFLLLLLFFSLHKWRGTAESGGQ